MAERDPARFGSPSDFTLAGATLGSVVVAEPVTCNNGEVYIRVTRAAGTRTIALGVGDYPGRYHGMAGCWCLVAGADRRREVVSPTAYPGGLEACLAKQNDSCPEVQFEGVIGPAMSRLHDQGIPTGGYGRGACSQPNDDPYERMHAGFNITNWRDADAAVRAVAAELEAWDINGHVGVSMRYPMCARPASGKPKHSVQ